MFFRLDVSLQPLRLNDSSTTYEACNSKNERNSSAVGFGKSGAATDLVRTCERARNRIFVSSAKKTNSSSMEKHDEFVEEAAMGRLFCAPQEASQETHHGLLFKDVVAGRGVGAAPEASNSAA